jgi:ubiquitin C
MVSVVGVEGGRRTAEKYPLFVHASDTIAEIKTHIQQAKGIPTHLQRLIVTDPHKEFTDESQSLADYRIRDLSTMYVVLNRDSIPSTAFNIHVQMDGKSGKSISLDVASDTKVAAVKTLIQDREGIPREQQRLLFADQEPSDFLYLAECGVAPGSSLHLVLKLRGC